MTNILLLFAQVLLITHVVMAIVQGKISAF